MRPRGVGALAERLAPVSQRLVHRAAFGDDGAEVDPRVEVPRVQRQRPAVGRLGALSVALLGSHGAQAVVQLGVLGP
jgi:hypothetical protein